MKVALIVLALVAVAAADYKSYQQDYAHVPYYKFDWDVTAEGYGGYSKDGYSKDSYGEALKFAQYEAREKDHTTGNWHTQLPKGHIKFDYDINAHSYQGYKQDSYKQDYKPTYKADYKAPEYKEEYKASY